MKYYAIPLTQTIDSQICSNKIQVSDTNYYAELADDTVVDSSWTVITEDQWNAAFLGVKPNEIDIAKAKKIQELQQESDNATSTFQSSALGMIKTYLADEKSMTFLAGEYAFVKSPDYDGSTTDWYTVEDGTFVTHTGAEIAQVFLDGRAWIKQQKTVKLKTLLADVETAYQAGDQAEIEAITW